MTEWIDISTPYLKGKEIEYLSECINSNYVSTVGPFIKKFETEIGNHLGFDESQIVATNSGTSALQLGLISIGVKPNEIVILPTYSFIATANSITYLGANPWFIDVESEFLTLDPLDLEKELKENTYKKNNSTYLKKTDQRIACIVPVYVFGYPPDLNALNKIANDYSIPLLLDSACGIGSRYKGKNFSELNMPGIISFNGNKTITSGAGGIFYSTDKKKVALVRHLASTAKYSSNYKHDMVGFNYRMSNIQAALGLAQAEQLSKIIHKKKSINRIYYKEFKNLNYLKFIDSPPWGESSYWINFFILDNKYLEKSEDLINFLNKNRIKVNYFWKPLHLQKPYYGALRSFQLNGYENLIQKKVIPLPSSSNLNKNDQAKIVNLIKTFFDQFK